jgi:hypothetical protein
MCTAMCNVHLSSDQAQSVWQRAGNSCIQCVQGTVNHCTCSDELYNIKQDSKLCTERTRSSEMCPQA